MSLSFYFSWKILLSNIVDPDQTPHYVASDLGLHCLPMTLCPPCMNGLMEVRGVKQVRRSGRRKHRREYCEHMAPAKFKFKWTHAAHSLGGSISVSWDAIFDIYYKF